jgi:hypothetical protein
VDRVLDELHFKGNQALRLVSLLALKFERFRDDLRDGFSSDDLALRDCDLVKHLCASGHRMDQHEVDTVELLRNIRRKFEQTLRLFEIIRATPRLNLHRMEVAPNTSCLMVPRSNF